jgi:UDP-N-acetylglucosamine 4,6-dehydratase
MIKRLHDTQFLNGKSVLITGGTGSLGNELVDLMVRHYSLRRIIIFSRDEYKQHVMAAKYAHVEAMRFFLGDVRDQDRLRRAFQGVDYVIHAAALKQVPAAEYNPFEFVRTNVLGAQNIIEAAIDAGIQRLVALSTDKAANPVNVYGATKLCSDKLFVAGNSYSAPGGCRFAVVRYGNVVGSRGSVIPLFVDRRKSGVLPLTDPAMTRFWITLEEGATLVLNALVDMHGGELYVPKIPSSRISDLARLIAPDCKIENIGIRPGEKVHEIMIGREDARNTVDCGTHFVVQPMLKFWEGNGSCYAGLPRCPEGFSYTSDTNKHWVTDEEMKEMILSLKIGGIDDLAQEWKKASAA